MCSDEAQLHQGQANDANEDDDTYPLKYKIVRSKNYNKNS